MSAEPDSNVTAAAATPATQSPARQSPDAQSAAPRSSVAQQSEAPSSAAQSSAALAARYRAVRGFTDRLVEPLTAEDCVIQTMPDVSPTRWHLAHTSWFFETFVLVKRPGYRVFDPAYEYLFNSYYNSVGAQYPRPRRGLLSRPGLDEIRRYRQHVDEHLLALLDAGQLDAAAAAIVELGLQHEQQHQELIVTDIKHVFSCNPLLPVYRQGELAAGAAGEPKWYLHPGGIYEAGHPGPGFAFDNESPRHQTLLPSFELANRPVTCREFLAFVEDGGYSRSQFWLSLGWQTVCEQSWQCPPYWQQRDGRWWQFTLAGLQPLCLDAPVCHVSYFEADAFARWAGGRLPTEFEWEAAAATAQVQAAPGGHFADELLDAGLALHPHPADARQQALPLMQMLGDVWEWTASAYAAYPGYQPPEGALGEYNGKFMCNQYVLRGGSCATSRSHIRSTYRNFFPPEARWQFSGFRLARNT